LAGSLLEQDSNSLGIIWTKKHGFQLSQGEAAKRHKLANYWHGKSGALGIGFMIPIWILVFHS